MYTFLSKPSKRRSKLQEKLQALNREHPPHQNNTYLHFFFSWFILCASESGSDPHSQCGSGFRSSRPKSMRISADPNLQHWFFHTKSFQIRILLCPTLTASLFWRENVLRNVGAVYFNRRE